MTEPVRFTRQGVWAGFLATVPVALSIFVFGLVFGIVAGQKGLSPLETVLMSGVVFAGASQMLAMELWQSPVPILTLGLAALVINLRYLMMTAALKPWLASLPAWKAYGTLYVIADENWAVSISEMRAGGRDAGFLLGSGLAIYSFWLVASLIGRLFGAVIEQPERFGLDFVSTAVFVALAVGLWRGRGEILPWLVAGGVALLVKWLLPGTWYLIAGGLAGSLVGAWRDVR
jgi:4-azaleucine resistance transporter AzlC